MRSYAFAAVCALVACTGEVTPVTECGAGARSVDGVCRPLCGGPSECLLDETCVDGVCLPGQLGAPDAAPVGVDATELAPDAEVAKDAVVERTDASEPEDVGGPRDMGTVDRDAGFPDARPPRDASPIPMPDLVVAMTGSLPDPMLVDERFAVGVTIANDGDLASGSVVVAMFVNPRGTHDLRPESLRIGEATANGVAAGATAVVTVNARVPNTAPPGDRTVIVVVDPDQRVMELDESNNLAVAGDVGVTTLTVEPVSLDFGTVLAPCGQSSRSMQIVNRSMVVAANITSIQLASMSDVFEPRPPMTPTMLGPNMVMGFATLFHPEVPGPAQNMLRIAHGQPGSPLLVPLAGEGISGRVTQTFPPMTRARAGDVVFVVDPHLSDAARDDLAAAAGTILSDLGQRGIAYRVAVRQAGALAGSRGFLGTPAFITPANMAGVNELASRIQDTHVALTIVANDGFSEIDATLAAGTPGLAADAWLEVIVVSESDDETNLAPATLASRVNAEKPVDGVSAVSGIVVPNGSTGTCMRSTTTRYNGVITGTGGRSTSVCARNWNTVLGNLGGALFGTQFAYPLTGAPDAASIAVTVGGVTLGASDYTYDPTQNRVLLSAGALPEPNATVDVSYVPVCP